MEEKITLNTEAMEALLKHLESQQQTVSLTELLSLDAKLLEAEAAAGKRHGE